MECWPASSRVTRERAARPTRTSGAAASWQKRQASSPFASTLPVSPPVEKVTSPPLLISRIASIPGSRPTIRIAS